MRRTVAAALVVAVMAGTAWGQAVSVPGVNPAVKEAKSPADVAVKRVVLFSSGVGFFEHEGMVEGNFSAPMRFETAQINDVLKSLVVYDRDGGAVKNVTYSATDPVSKTLKSFQVDLSGNPPLADIVNQMRGAGVVISVGDETIEGTVLGVESKERAAGRGDKEKVITTWTVNVITAAGIRAVSLDDVRKLEVKDEKIKKEMGQALAALAQARDQTKKLVTVNFEGTGKRRVGLSYLVETPIWKTSYRLMLPDATSKDVAKLQGWAIVENQTDNDWTDVELSLVGGRPLGFIELLYQPLYNPRPVVQPDIAASVRPQTYGGGQTEEEVARVTDMRDMNVKPPSFNLDDTTKGGSSGGGQAGGGSLFSTTEQQNFTSNFGKTMKDYSQGVASVAQTSKIGEMFHYNVEKVTLPRQQSSMIPIISEGVEFERVSIFNHETLANQLLRGVRLKNKTGKYLLGGPVTVLDTVKEGTSYAGDARVDDIPPEQTRLLSYAVDQDMTGEVARNDTEMDLMGAGVAKGMLRLSYRNRNVKEYVLVNKSGLEKTVVVETPVLAGFELKEPAKYAEKTETLYRMQVTLPAKSGGKVRVVQEQTTRREEAIIGIAGDPLVFYLRQGTIPDKVKEVLKAVEQRRDEAAALDRNFKKKQQERARILEEQANIRENIRVLPQGSKSLQDAVNDLGTHDVDLKKATKEMHDLQDAMEKAKAELEKFVAGVVVE